MNPAVLIEQAKDAFAALRSLTACFCASDSTLKLNGRSYKILKLVGEGGFSFIYLVEDITSARVFALKKIRCPLGSESVRTALKEVEAYKRFRHPSIIRCLDSCVVQEGEGKIIYLFLPYYKNGTIQHIINTNAVNGSKYDEKAMLSIFLGTCDAVRAMHHYVAGPTAAYPPVPTSASSPSDVDRSGGIRLQDEDEEEDDDDGPIMTGGEGEALIGGLSGAAEEEAAEEGASAEPVASGSRIATDQKVQPWAHRDIKPANIMIADDGKTPILMDFGSTLPGRIPVPTRSVALAQQDSAAEHCSMPFRAPELFDVRTGSDLTEAVDIWSLGCTLYAMAYGTSPFETLQQSEFGGSIAMAVLGGKYSFPANDYCSESFRDLIKMMLVVKPSDRPDIDAVIEATSKALSRLD